MCGIALLHADDGYYRCVNLYGYWLFVQYGLDLFNRWHQRVWFKELEI